MAGGGALCPEGTPLKARRPVTFAGVQLPAAGLLPATALNSRTKVHPMNMHTSRATPASIPPTDVARELLDIRNNLQRELQRVDILLGDARRPHGCGRVSGGHPRRDAAPILGETSSASDLLYGAPAIAGYLGLTEKQARHRVEAGNIPAFKIGGTILRPPFLPDRMARGSRSRRRACGGADHAGGS